MHFPSCFFTIEEAAPSAVCLLDYRWPLSINTAVEVDSCQNGRAGAVCQQTIFSFAFFYCCCKWQDFLLSTLKKKKEKVFSYMTIS